ELAAPGRAKKTVRDAPALRHGYADVVVDLFTYRFPTRGTTTQAAYDGLDATLRATVQAVREATDRDLFDAYRTARGRRHEYHTARRAGHDMDSPVESHTRDTTKTRTGKAPPSIGFELEFALPLNRPHRVRKAALTAITNEIEALTGIGELHVDPPSGTTTTKDRDATLWYLDDEPSVPGGAEIVVPKFSGTAQEWERLGEVFRILRRHGAESTVRTGGHIHFGSIDGGGGFRPHVRVLKLFKAVED